VLRAILSLLRRLSGRPTAPAVQTSPAASHPAWASGDEAALDVIRHFRPTILSHLSTEEVDRLRPLAERSFKGDVPRKSEWRDIKISGDMPTDVAIRMLEFYGCTARNLVDWKLSGVVDQFEILSAKDACPFCQRYPRGPYRLDEAPEIPLSGCTHKMGCRCMPLPKL
jgi:hypothetical protein